MVKQGIQNPKHWKKNVQVAVRVVLKSTVMSQKVKWPAKERCVYYKVNILNCLSPVLIGFFFENQNT